MKNPLKFIQEVKQETFRITWPTKKDTMMGAVMVFALASIAAIFFLILDQILRFLLNFLGLCSSSMGKILRFFKKLNLVFFINKYFLFFL